MDDIYSLRLVIADFYMEKPVFGLDPCYSELRGKEIKRVRNRTQFQMQLNIYNYIMYISGAHCAYIWCQCKWAEMLHACAWSISLFLYTLR